MRVAVLFLVGLVAVSASFIPSQGPERIMGGQPATLQNFPYTASLLRGIDNLNFYNMCGGSILNTRAILTAAHCLVGSTTVQLRTRVGSVQANSGGTVHFTTQIIIHPNFNVNTFNSDIGLLHTTTTIVYVPNAVQPAYIAGPNYNIAANQAVWAIGWGPTVIGGPMSASLQQVQVWTVSQATCRLRYAELGIGVSINDNMLCAGWLDVGGRGQCDGDSGSPLLHNGVIIGVFSFSFQCGLPRQPAVNTRVSTYSNWIANNA